MRYSVGMTGEELERAERGTLSRPTTPEGIAAAWLVGHSARTRAAYLADLRDYGRFCEGVGLDPLAAHRAHIDAYKADLEGRGLSPATVARRLSALAGFYGYAQDEGLIARSPVARVKRPRVGSESPTLGLDVPELGRFLEAAAKAGPRDNALASLLALNGLRVSEICEAEASDLETVRGHRTLTVTRKGGRRAVVALAPRTVEALEAHLAGRESGPLLLDNGGGRLDRHDATRIVRRLARAAEIDKRISPHSLRHSFVTAALDAGATLRDVQDAAGHADPRTTRRYDRARQSLDRHPTYAVAAALA